MPHTENSKRKMSKSRLKYLKTHPVWNKGKHLYSYNSGKNHPMFGKHHSDNSKQKIRNKLIGKIKNQKSITSGGYIIIYQPNHPFRIMRNSGTGYVFEHRLVIEKYLGRYLNSKERIHHLDGDKINNKIENLILCKNPSEHYKIHWAMERFMYNLVKEKKIGYNKENQTFNFTK